MAASLAECRSLCSRKVGTSSFRMVTTWGPRGGREESVQDGHNLAGGPAAGAEGKGDRTITAQKGPW